MAYERRLNAAERAIFEAHGGAAWREGRMDEVFTLFPDRARVRAWLEGWGLAALASGLDGDEMDTVSARQVDAWARR